MGSWMCHSVSETYFPLLYPQGGHSVFWGYLILKQSFKCLAYQLLGELPSASKPSWFLPSFEEKWKVGLVSLLHGNFVSINFCVLLNQLEQNVGQEDSTQFRGVSYKLSCFRSTHFIFLLTLTAFLLPGNLEVFYLV